MAFLGLSLSTIYWLVAIAGAGLSCLCGLLRLSSIDRQRHSARPTLHEYASGKDASLPTRDAPVMCATTKEPVAHLDRIIDTLHTGDVFLFSGRALHSYLIRIPTWSRMSHCGLIVREKNGQVLVAEVVERLRIVRHGWWFRIDKGGFQFVLLADYVKNHPGQCYVAKVAHEFDKPAIYSRVKIREAIDASTGWSYGWSGIGFQCLAKLPIFRELTYLCTWRNIDTTWGDSYSPFCSWATSLWATIAGQDPTPCLAAQLTTPAEIERSKLWAADKIALVP